MVIAMDDQKEQNSNNDSKGVAIQCNKVILDHFWTLADPDESRRCRSAQVILQTLTNQVNRKHEKNDIQYCFDRVIKGLTSTRAFARHGFCVLFSALISEFHTHCDLNDLFELARKEFGPKITADTLSENTIAWSLFLASLSKSGRLTSCNQELIKEIFELCLVLGSKKDFVEIIITDVIKSLIEDISEDDFENSYLDIFKNTEDNRKNSLFFIYSILLINERFPDLKDTFVSTFITSNVYKKASKKFDKIVAICKESTKSYPHIHPIVKILIETVHKIDPENFEIFYSTIIDKLLTSNFEKVLLAFEMIKVLIGFVKSDQISKLFSPSFIELFIKALAWKDNPNHNKAIELGDFIIEFSSTIKNNSNLQFELAKCFVEKPGGVHFDELSKSKILQSILKNFDDNAIQAWIKYLQNLFLNEENIPNSDFTRIRAYQQMVNVAKQYRKIDSFITETLLFLFCHAYVDFEKTNKISLKSKQKIGQFKVSPTEKLSALFGEGYRNVLFHMSQVEIEKTDSKKVKIQKKNSFLQAQLESVNEIIEDKKIYFKENFDRENVHSNIVNVLSKIEQIKELDEKTMQSYTFIYLYLNFAFELFENSTEICLVLPDFDECVNRCLLVKNKKSKKTKGKKQETDGEPQWADVLTDLFLSLLSKNSKHMKNVILTSFRHISPFVTKVGIDAINDAFMGKSADNESDDDEDDEEEEEDQNEKDDEKSNEDENESSEEDDDDEDFEMDDNEEVDPEFKQKLIEALGDAAELSEEDDDEDDESTKKVHKKQKTEAKSEDEKIEIDGDHDDDDDDDDDEGMDDEAMFRIDDALAEVFRNKFGDKKKNQSEREQLINFRSRSIELIQMIIENKEDLDINLVLELSLNLISLTRSTYSVKTMSTLANKCVTVLESLIKRKNFDNLSNYDEKLFVQVIEALVSFQYKCTNKSINQKLVQTTVWLIGLFKDNINDLSKLIETFDKALRDYCVKSLHIDKNLFVRVIPIFVQIEKNNFQKTIFYKILVENCFNQNRRMFQRSQALDVMSLILGNLKNSFKDNTCYNDLTKAAIKQLNEDLNTTDKKENKLSGQYLNTAIRLICNTNIFDEQHSDKLKHLSSDLNELLNKFEKIPKETRRKIDKGFIKKIKNSIEKE